MKNTFLKIICAIIVFVMMISMNVYAEEQSEIDYRVENIDGAYYLIFDDVSKYTRHNILVAYERWHFESMNEVKELLLENKLDESQKRYIANIFAREDESGIYRLPDLDNLYAPVVPAGFKIVDVSWHNDFYDYFIRLDESKGGFFTFLTESRFEQYYNWFSDPNIDIEIIGKEMTDGDEIITYRKSNKDYKLIRTSFTKDNKTTWIDKTYVIPSDGELDISKDYPIGLELYIREGNAYGQIKFLTYNQKIDISDDVLLDFGVTDNIEEKGIVLPGEEKDTQWIVIGSISATVVLASALMVTVPLKRKKKLSFSKDENSSDFKNN